MRSPRGAAAHVGRIGALAVTLGVGAWTASTLTGAGVAWADTADTSSQPSSQQSAANTRSSAPARSTRTPAARPQTSTGGSGRNPVASAASRPAATKTRRSDAVSPQLPQPVSPPAVSFPVIAPADPVSVPTPTGEPVMVAPLAALPEVAAPAEVVISAPVRTVAARTAAPAPNLVSRVLSAVGIDALNTGNSPEAPLDAPLLWTLAAFTRRDVGAAPAAATTAAPAAAVVPSSLTSTPVGWVTGQNNSGFPGTGWPQTNNTQWAGIYGTDLGIMWLNGVNNKVQLAFGDTFSGANMTGNWRSNVLLLSQDTTLYNGLTLDQTGYANQFIPAARNQVFFIGSEVTNIPTSAVYANNNNYVSYMSVKSWDSPGRWTTNYSAISMYNPSTDKWVLQTSTVRSAGWFRSSTPYRAGDQNFQQMAYVLQPESKVTGSTRYVYAFGTPAGRAGSAFLSRVPQGSITDLSQYEYWDGSTWVKDRPAVAAPVLGDSPNSAGLFGFVVDLANNPNFFGGWFAGLFGAKTGGNVSEMSIQYNDYLGKYVVMYANGLNNIVLRTADTPEGPWSTPITVASSIQYPGLYAPMIHPLSGTSQLIGPTGAADTNNLYWNMSLWGNYNVVLMKTDLTALHTV